VTDAGRRSGDKALAIDLGSRRIGLAVSDRAGSMAFPHSVIERSNDPAADRAAIAAAVQETGATTVVVGLPLSLDGTDGPAARAARAQAGELADALGGTSVVLFDERLTTVSARAALVAAGRKGRRQRAVVDSAAAAVLLQSWLDAGRPVG
jgi:putative Holliday junction resolvase